MDTEKARREPAIDALRGFCLLGIALVNVPWIGSPRSLAAVLFDDALRVATPIWDLIAAAVVEWLAEGKFYPQFSALFGFGAGVLLARGWGIYLRRIGVLLIFGLLHATFGWWGDILINYALVGACLVVLWFLPPRWLLAFSIASLVAGCGLSYFFDGWLVPDATSDAEAAEYIAHNVEIYGHGTFVTISQHRFEEIFHFFDPWNYSYRTNTLTMASFGLWVQRSGLLNELATKRRQLGIAAAILCGVGVLLALAPWFYIPGGDVLGMGWAALFLWAATGSLRPALLALEPLGKMAISAYLGQTLVFTLFFYAYGLGMYGRLGPLAGVALATVTWAFELAFARWWMQRFQLGPVEWLWRSATYLRWMPLQRPAT